jgi:PAS domain S-box-containing protein
VVLIIDIGQRGSARNGAGGLTPRNTILIIFLYSVAVLGLLPIASIPGPEIPGTTAAFGGVIFVSGLSTAFLLFLRFRETPAWSLLFLGCGYLFSALMVVPHVLTFPGAIVPGQAVIGLSPQSPGWLFVLWINGYALLTLIAIVLAARNDGWRPAQGPIGAAIAVAVAAVLMLVVALSVFSIVIVDGLPPLIGGSSWTTLNRFITTLALLLLVSGVATIIWRIRDALFLWLSLALTAMAFANILSEVGGARYSIGWSAGRVSWLISASILFLYFLNQYARHSNLLRTSEQHFELLVQGVKDYAIFMLDLEGRITSWNSGAQHIKGYRPEEIIGQHFSVFYPAEDKEAGVPAQALSQAKEKGKYEAEGWRVRKDGTRLWASVIIDPICDSTGKLVGFAKVTRDITERRHAQEMLEQARDRLFQSQKMEAVGQLTGGVAHDFNNLLTIIVGNIDTAKRHVSKLTGGVADQLMRVLTNARTGADRAAVLTQRLLAFSRRQPLAPKPLDVNKFIAAAVDFLQRSLGERIHIEAVGAGGLW